MASRNVEITIVSAENLTRQLKLVTKNVYVVVKLDNSQKNDNVYSTKVQSDVANNHPSWNEKLEINLPSHSRFITLEVYSRAHGNSVARIIGTAHVPVSDFLANCTPPFFLHCLSYRLRDEKGEKNGVINISVRVTEGFEDYVAGTQQREDVCLSSVAVVEPPTVGVSIGYNSGGVVTGVPAIGWSVSKA